MVFNIPNSTFDMYYEICDHLLENDIFSRECTVFYPSKKVSVSNPTNVGGDTNNVYQGGGSAPFSFNSQVMQGQEGYKEEIVTSTVRLRIYWNRNQWVKINSIVAPNATCQIIGYMSDVQKLVQMDYIQLISDISNLDIRCRLLGNPIPHGFGKNRYFVAYLQEIV